MRPQSVATARASQELAVVGHGQEVEGAIDACPARGLALGIDGKEGDRLTARVAVGIGGEGSDAVGRRIEGEGRVDVEVAEERL